MHSDLELPSSGGSCPHLLTLPQALTVSLGTQALGFGASHPGVGTVFREQQEGSAGRLLANELPLSFLCPASSRPLRAPSVPAHILGLFAGPGCPLPARTSKPELPSPKAAWAVPATCPPPCPPI